VSQEPLKPAKDLDEEVDAWAEEGASILLALSAPARKAALKKGSGTAAAGRSSLLAVCVAAKEAFSGLTEKLIGGGSTVAAWAGEFAFGIGSYMAAGVMGLASRLWVAEEEAAPLVTHVAEQERYVRKFASGLKSGAVEKTEAVVSRAGSYADAVWAAAFGVALAVAGSTGKTEAKRVLGFARHCDDCLALSLMGWVPMGEFVPIGRASCGSHCKCHALFR
jgi:hypothetical protein